MLTDHDLEKLTINAEVAKEALAQAEKRLVDQLETKKSMEQKASMLLTGFTTLALAMISAGGVFLKDALPGHFGGAYLPFAFFAAGVPLVLSAWYMIRVLQPIPYGNLGSTPEMWLQPGTIDGPSSTVENMQAFITYYMQKRIDVSEASNNLRDGMIARGSTLALASPVLLLLGLATAARLV